MKYVKTFEELNINEVNPDKVEIGIMPKEEFRKIFFKKYPKKETAIQFKDKYSTYELYLSDIKFNDNFSSFDLIFKTESLKNVSIKTPYYISDIDMNKISILRVEITPESLELVKEMSKFGLPEEEII